jgi:S1-C subfamily serine protease
MKRARDVSEDKSVDLENTLHMSNLSGHWQTLSQEISQIVGEVSGALVPIRGRRSAATGIHWRSGLIVTSCEALHPEDALYLNFATDRAEERTKIEVEWLGSDPTTDVAILALPDGVDLPLVTLGDSTKLALGDLVVTVGHGWRGGLFASLGMISHLAGPWRSMSGGQIDQRIQVDLNLERASAGAPLVNAQGQVVGFNTFGPKRKVLTIPATTVNRVMEQLQTKGKVSRGYLGLGMQSVKLPDGVKTQLSLTQPYGVMIVSIEPQAAADKAGMLLGDVMVAMNDTTIEDIGEIQAFLDPHSVGQPLVVRLIRAGQLQTVTVSVGER